MGLKKSLWNPSCELVLASKSLTRRRLLEDCGIPILSVDSELDERELEAELKAKAATAVEIASALAAAKASKVSQNSAGRLCLGADQVLVLDGVVFHKPRDREEAMHTLAQLSARTHLLVSAFAIASEGRIIREGSDSAELTMRALDRNAICRYLDYVGEAALTSVGAYQVEAAGIHLFETITGAHSTILGLPLIPLLSAFRSLRLLEV